MSKKITITPANCICGTYRITLDGVTLRKTATRPYRFATPNQIPDVRDSYGNRISDLPKCSSKPFMGGVPVVATCIKCGTVWTPARGVVIEAGFEALKKQRAAEFYKAHDWKAPAAPAAVAAPANDEADGYEVRAAVVQNPAPAGKVRVMADDFSDEPARNLADPGEIRERAERLCFNVNLKMAKFYAGSAVARDRVRTTDSGTKFMRIVRGTAGGSSRSVFCFIDLRNGDILKAAGWKAPAKHARGSVLADDYGLSAVGPYGPAYLTNSKSAGVKLIPGMGWGDA